MAIQKQALSGLLAHGLNAREAAKKLRVGKTAVYRWIAELGLPKRKYTKSGESQATK